MPCAAGCGRLLWRGSTSLPEGRATCRPCRAAAEWKHGTRAGYRTNGCRCDECREWKNAEARDLRAKRRAEDRVYKRKSRWAGKPRTCEQCGEQFATTRNAQRFCSLRCNGRAQRRQHSTELVHVGPKVIAAPPTPVTVVTLPKWWGVIIQGPCGWCGDAFTATSGSARYCSDRCSKSAGLARRGKFKIAPRIRRAIYERDNFTCQLCMEPVDIDADPWSDWYPSLDHVIPQSHVLIPDHSLANLRTAHRWCNAVRGDGTWHADFFEGVA